MNPAIDLKLRHKRKLRRLAHGQQRSRAVVRHVGQYRLWFSRRRPSTIRATDRRRGAGPWALALTSLPDLAGFRRAMQITPQEA